MQRKVRRQSACLLITVLVLIPCSWLASVASTSSFVKPDVDFLNLLPSICTTLCWSSVCNNPYKEAESIESGM
jgi:hypothetical protein